MEKTKIKLHFVWVEINKKCKSYHKASFHIKCSTWIIRKKIVRRKNKKVKEAKANLRDKVKVETQG